MQKQTALDLLNALKSLPNAPGVYQYYDKNGKLLYIGKAKNLKNRVRSYFSFTQTIESLSSATLDSALLDSSPIPNPKVSQRISIMVRQISSLEIIKLDSEQDALILENSLIKQLKPKYNILLRDDKTYPYICFNLNSDFPTPEITRTITKEKNIVYFGPYPSGANEILDSILEFFKLVQKKSCIKTKKSCLFYQIHRCYAPCEGKISKSQYKQILDSAIDVLKNPSKLLAKLKEKMFFLSESMRFEEALVYRERIKKLSNLQSFSLIDLAKNIHLDVLHLYYEGKRAILLCLFVRGGKIVSFWHNMLYFDYEYIPSEIYTQAILNHYKQALPIIPSEILLPSINGLDREILESYLAQTQGKKIHIITPQKGDKFKLIELALKNAKEIFHNQTQITQNEQAILSRIKETFTLESTPFRIEIFDTSHHSGSDCVGGMIVYENGAFIKEAYRRYKLEGKDEYTQMREMLIRRAKDFSHNPPPNLWLIDGGKAQINLAKEILESSGIYIDVIGIAKQKLNAKAYRAKGNARDTIYTNEQSFLLEPSDTMLQFFQKLRDEAHRYTISYHRLKKSKSLTHYNDIKLQGLSDAKIKRLLSIVGSYEAIKTLSQKDIKSLLKSHKN